MKQCPDCKEYYPANRAYFPAHAGLPFDARPCKQCRSKRYGKSIAQRRKETTRQAAIDRATGNVDLSYFDEWQLPVLADFRRNTFTKRRDFFIKGAWKSKRDLVAEYLRRHKKDLYLNGDVLRVKISNWIEKQIDWLDIEHNGLVQETVHFIISVTTINRVRRDMRGENK